MADQSGAGSGRKKRAAVRHGCVAVTGAAGTFGRRVVEALAAETQFSHLVALVHQPRGVTLPEAPSPWPTHRVDLTEPTADARLADVLGRERVETLVHAAFHSRPWADAELSHELEVIGTLHVLSACAAAGVRRVVVLSSTMVYGAQRENAAHISEEAPLRGHPGFPFVRDKVEAESEVQRFVASRKGLSATVLRLCPMVGPGFKNLWSTYYRRPFAPTVLGYDPLMQVLHPTDAYRAIRRAVVVDRPGAYNIVGRGVIPLSTALRMTGAIPVPLARPGVGAWMGALRTLGIAASPPPMADYLTFSWVADGRKAAHELDFIPQYSPREVLMQLVGATAAPAQGGLHG